jgi:hypothetical protein
VLSTYCGGQYTEKTRHGEVRQRFTSRPPAGR